MAFERGPRTGEGVDVKDGYTMGKGTDVSDLSTTIQELNLESGVKGKLEV